MWPTCFGFARESLNAKMRLLDDLNLDSIKAGDLVSRISKALSIDAPFEPLEYANASLGDVMAGFEKAGGTREAADARGNFESAPDALETVIGQACELTGYPVENIDADALVERELNISPDRLLKLVQRSAKVLAIDYHLDLEPLRKRSLRQIASILDRMVKGQSGTAPMGPAGGSPPHSGQRQQDLLAPRRAPLGPRQPGAGRLA